MTVLLELVAAAAIGVFLGIILKKTCQLAAVSWSQERTLLRQAREALADADPDREPGDWQADPYDRIPT